MYRVGALVPVLYLVAEVPRKVQVQHIIELQNRIGLIQYRLKRLPTGEIYQPV